MRKKYLVYILIIVIIGIYILTNIKFKENINFSEDCISFDIGSFDYDVVKVEIEGVIRKKIFEDVGEIDLTLRIGAITYPIITEKMTPLGPRHEKTIDPNNIKSMPAIDSIETYSIEYDDYVNIALKYFYLNDYTKEIDSKNYGNLYIDIDNEIIMISLYGNENDLEGWSFDEGYPVVLTGDDILSSIENTEYFLKWNLEKWQKYYNGEIQN